MLDAGHNGLNMNKPRKEREALRLKKLCRTRIYIGKHWSDWEAQRVLCNMRQNEFVGHLLQVFREWQEHKQLIGNTTNGGSASGRDLKRTDINISRPASRPISDKMSALLERLVIHRWEFPRSTSII